VIGVGAGGRDPATHPNVVRLLLGEPVGADTATEAVVLETNVDDLDPRVWPHVLQALMAAGASDAWLTPILMKKGRPAHTLAVLCRPEVAEQVRAVLFAETSAIGLREVSVGKRVLERDFAAVHIDGQRVRVKIARAGARVVNVQPEYDDVATAAATLGRPVKAVLAQAVAACASSWGGGEPEPAGQER
jgi:uncharacterized protein (DUF111 family)